MLIEGISSDTVRACVDKRGFSTLAINAPVSLMLAAAFEADIQTASTAALVYSRLDGVAEGRDLTAQFSGNSCTVRISQGRVSIENDVLEHIEPFEMSTQQYRVILDVWSAFLEGLRES